MKLVLDEQIQNSLLFHEQNKIRSTRRRENFSKVIIKVVVLRRRRTFFLSIMKTIQVEQVLMFFLAYFCRKKYWKKEEALKISVN